VVGQDSRACVGAARCAVEVLLQAANGHHRDVPPRVIEGRHTRGRVCIVVDVVDEELPMSQRRRLAVDEGQ
jgi:hypothetical protein